MEGQYRSPLSRGSFTSESNSFPCPKKNQCSTRWLEAQFTNPVFTTMKNALILSIAHPLRSIAAVILNLLPAAMFVLLGGEVFASLGFIWFLFGFSGTAVLNSMMFRKVFGFFIDRAKAEEGKEKKQAEEIEKSPEEEPGKSPGEETEGPDNQNN